VTTILDVASDIHRATGKTPITPRWEATLRVFYGLELRPEDIASLERSTRRTSNGLASLPRRHRRELWARVGRRGRKTVVTALVGVFEAMFGGHERYLLPGERGLIAIVSKDAAGSTLVARFCEMHAEALGVSCNWSSIGAVRVLELDGFAFAVACFPCSAKSPRGYAIPVIIADEIAHWATDSDEYVNSDEAVLGAIKPAMAQFPDSRLIAISSPLGNDGMHFDTIEANLGDDADPDVLAVEGPTWEWNPEISEARTHEIEKDPQTHAREFGAKPSDNEGTAFVPGDAEACFARHPGLYHWGRPFLVLDPAETTNTFSWLVGAWGEPTRQRQAVMVDIAGITEAYPLRDAAGNLTFHPIPERPLLRISQLGGWTGEELRSTTMDRVAAELGRIAMAAGADTALSDRRGDVYLAALLSPHRLKLRSFTITNDSKHEAVKFIRTLMRDRQISIIDHDGMRTDLRTYPRRITGGRFKYGEARSNQKKHWDHASLLVTLAHSLIKVSDETGTSTTETHVRIEGAPFKTPGSRTTVLGR
jgi:hypothetical protein